MEIKGTALLAIRDFVKTNHGEHFEQWLKILDEDSRQIFENPIDSTKWYPVDSAAEIPTQKISEMFFNSDNRKGAWESGRFSAEKGLSGIYKIFVKASSPTFIISRAKDVFAKYYQPCEMRVTKLEKNNVVLEMTGSDGCSEVIEYRIAGWIEKALEISGAGSVQVDITKAISKGEDITEFSISWS